MGIIVRSVVVGTLVVLVGTIPHDLLFFANLHYWPSAPWAVPVMAVYLWFFWRYLRGSGQPESTTAQRRTNLRANSLPLKVWMWSLISGALGIVTLVLALRLANRLVILPEQPVPDLSGIPLATVLSLVVTSAPIAGLVEEAAFRGYMQGPIERRYGPAIAILITGTVFALAHLDFTLILWPYYLAVAAIYGTVTYLTNSILPAVVLHTAGNIYSSLDLWMHRRAEWQASNGSTALIRQTGLDTSLRDSGIVLLIVAVATIWPT